MAARTPTTSSSRPLVVGISPPRSTPEPFADGACPSARRLARLLGVPDLGAAADLANLSDEWPPLARVPAAARREGALRLRRRFSGPRLVLACGLDVAVALGGPGTPLAAAWAGDWLVVCLPHPSGRNRWWNGRGEEEAGVYVRRLTVGHHVGDG